jgi:superfamily I DNA/RNA helicase
MMTAVLGGPGTGKTEYLVKRVQNLLEKTSIQPEQVGYFSFTKRAATEAKLRAAQTLGLPLKRFPFFCTLHSMAFYQLGLNKGRVLSSQHMAEFAKWRGLDLSPSYGSVAYTTDDTWPEKTVDDHCLFLMNYARVLMLPQDRLEWLPWRFHPQRALRNIKAYVEFKKRKYLYDYTDMLELLLERECYPNLDAIVIDEAQDLSYLQWTIVERIIDQNPNATVFIGGDDDQAIYEWAGASVQTFRNVIGAANKTVELDHSYRVPLTGYLMARYAIRRCKHRIPKSWRPTEERGSVRYVDNYEDIRWDLKKQYLCLARNKYLLKKAIDCFKDRKLPWSWMSYKNDALIQVSSIHGAKGTQASTVVLDVGLSKAAYNEGIRTDSEARVWYVALTRAQHDLILVWPARNRPSSLYIGDVLGYTCKLAS